MASRLRVSDSMPRDLTTAFMRYTGPHNDLPPLPHETPPHPKKDPKVPGVRGLSAPSSGVQSSWSMTCSLPWRQGKKLKSIRGHTATALVSTTSRQHQAVLMIDQFHIVRGFSIVVNLPEDGDQNDGVGLSLGLRLHCAPRANNVSSWPRQIFWRRRVVAYLAA
jgi:hypothetical protein